MIIQRFEAFNEAKYDEIHMSGLSDKWGAEYNLDDDIKKIKSKYKNYNRKELIDKIINITKNLNVETYNKIAKMSKTVFQITLPTYDKVIDIKYLDSHYETISKIIVIFSSIKKFIPKIHDEIENEIEKLQSQIENLKSQIDKL